MIWCVEDDADIRELLVYTLRATGFEAKGFEDAMICRQALQHEKPSLILLDVMLPGMDGVELLRTIKQSPGLCDIAVVMATAKGAEYDKVQCLDLGADDYLVKPFGMMEMVSRIKAVLRRAQPQKDAHVLRVSGVTLDPDGHTVAVDDTRITLTYKEYELLKVFMQSPGTVFTRDTLYSQVWESDFSGETRTVDMHIRTLRQKLGVYGELIETVRHVGYRMAATL